jgi:hypothetical protein
MPAPTIEPMTIAVRDDSGSFCCCSDAAISAFANAPARVCCVSIGKFPTLIVGQVGSWVKMNESLCPDIPGALFELSLEGSAESGGIRKAEVLGWQRMC